MNAIKRFVGSGFYSGLLPVMPGTWGSMAALVVIVPVAESYLWPGILVFIILCSIFTFWSEAACRQAWGPDPGRMVMDEWVGQALTFGGVLPLFHSQYPWFIIVSGFVLFRVFDISKVLGIHHLQKLPAGWGILADDLLAGIYAGLCLKFFTFMVVA